MDMVELEHFDDPDTRSEVPPIKTIDELLSTLRSIRDDQQSDILDDVLMLVESYAVWQSNMRSQQSASFTKLSAIGTVFVMLGGIITGAAMAAISVEPTVASFISTLMAILTSISFLMAAVLLFIGIVFITIGGR